jgi:hypothetical protein
MSLSDADISANWTQIAANESAIENATTTLNQQRTLLSQKRQEELAIVALIRSSRLVGPLLPDEDDKWQEVAQLRLDQATIRTTLNTLRSEIRGWEAENEERKELLQANALEGVELPTFPTLPAGTLALPPLYVAGRLDVAGDLAVEQDLDVSMGVAAAEGLDVSGAARLGASLDVSGAARFVGAVTADAGVSVGGALSVGTDLTVGGNLTVSGTQTVLNTETLTVEDNLIVVNAGFAGAPPSSLVSGLEVNRGSSAAYRLVFAEESNTFRVGEVGQLQAVATREDAPAADAFPRWNSAAARFDTAGSALALAGGRLAAGASLDVSGGVRVATSLEISGASTFVGDVALPGGAAWASAKAAGAFYPGSAADPSATTRLNYDGNLHLSNLVAMGNVTAYSTATASDARLKTDVAEMRTEVDGPVAVACMRPVAYTDRAGKRRVGFIAQELREAVPHVVNEDPETGLLSVAYGDLVAVLVDEAQAVRAEMQEMRAAAQETRAQLEALRAQVEAAAAAAAPASPQ